MTRLSGSLDHIRLEHPHQVTEAEAQGHFKDGLFHRLWKGFPQISV